MKKVLQIIMLLVVIGLAYWLYDMIMTPVNFKKEKALREAAVVERLKEVRAAERAFKQANMRYTGSFDTLINFVKYDSLTFERAIGSEDDSLAVAKGLVKREKFKVAVIDTVFHKGFDADKLRYIPHTNNEEIILGAGSLETESKVVVPVFEAKAPYKLFLSDLDQQELVNLLDERRALEKYKGLKVGSLTEATNDAGNWE